MSDMAADEANRAARMLEEARELFDQGNPEDAQSLMRSSLHHILRAYLLDKQEERLIWLHKIGRLLRCLFGCALEFRDGQYWLQCPVVSSHIPLGLSMGGSARATCSICRENALTCPHIATQIYDEVEAARIGEVCTICLQRECNHEVGKCYDGVTARQVMSDLRVDHVALTPNPNNPLCVVLGRSVSESEIMDGLSAREQSEFVFGETTIDCDHCLGDCSYAVSAAAELEGEGFRWPEADNDIPE